MYDETVIRFKSTLKSGAQDLLDFVYIRDQLDEYVLDENYELW